MNSHLFGFVLVAIIVCIECGEFYNVDGRKYFVSYPETRNWYQAMRYCAYNNMYLVDVISSVENARILSVINTSETAYGLDRLDYWTSGTDLGSEGRFYWATSGHQFVFNYWNESTPDGNGGKNENCVHFWQGNQHAWNAWLCDENMFFICRDVFDIPFYKSRECTIQSV